MIFEKLLTLNNGMTAKFFYLDDFRRPVYVINHKGKEYRVCCVELNGTFLHSLTKEGEPLAPLKHEFQPVKVYYA